MPILTPPTALEITPSSQSKKYSEAKRLGSPLLNEDILKAVIEDRSPSESERLEFKIWLRIEHDGNSEQCTHSNPLLCSCRLAKQYRTVDMGIVEFWGLDNNTLEVI